MNPRRCFGRLAVVLGAIASTLAAPLAQAQPGLAALVPSFKWCQRWTPPLASHISYVRDCNGTMAPGIPIALDDWKCTQSGPIWRIVWWGALLPNQPTAIPPPNRFFIQIWIEDPTNCKPIDFVYHVCVFPKFQYVGTDCLGNRVFRYSAPLPTPFTQVAGTKYWLQISEVEPNQPGVPPVGPRWCWSHHRPIENCPAAEQVCSATGCFTRCPLLDPCDNKEVDLAFCLYRRAIIGTITPVPALPAMATLHLIDPATNRLVESQCVMPMSDGFFDVFVDLAVPDQMPVASGEGDSTRALISVEWVFVAMSCVPIRGGPMILSDGDHDLGLVHLSYGDADADGSVRFRDIIQALATFGENSPMLPTVTTPLPGEEPE